MQTWHFLKTYLATAFNIGNKIIYFILLACQLILTGFFYGFFAGIIY